MKLSFNQKLNLSYTALIVVLISTFSYVTYQIYSADLRKNMEITIKAITQQINYNVDQYLDSLTKLSLRPLMNEDGNRSAMEQLLFNAPLGNMNYTELQQLEMLVNDYFMYPYAGEITAVHLIDNDETELSFFQIMQKEYQLSASSSPYYAEAKATNGRYVITETLSVQQTFNSDAYTQIFSIYRQLNDYETDQPYAMLVLDFNLNKLKNDLNTTVLGDASIIRIVNSANRIIYSTLPDEITGSYESQDPNKWFIGERHISKADWRIIVSVPISSVTHRTDLVFVSCILLVIAILFAAIFSSWFANKITKPLHQLQRLMKKTEKGEFNVQFYTKSRDEVFQLGNSFNHMIGKIKQLIDKVYMTEIHQKEAEFAALQSQISPHFLFNTLESIRMTAELDGSARSVQMIASLGRLLKVNMQQKKWITCQEEIEYIENYLFLQSMRLSYTLHWKITCDPELKGRSILAFLIQPLVENSIQHGIRPLLRPGEIEVYLKKEDLRHMRIIVADNGVGIPAEQLRELKNSLNQPEVSDRTGIGLVNVSQRMRYAFGKGYELQFSSTPDQGTRVEWLVPLTSNSTEEEREGGDNDGTI